MPIDPRHVMEAIRLSRKAYSKEGGDPGSNNGFRLQADAVIDAVIEGLMEPSSEVISAGADQIYFYMDHVEKQVGTAANECNKAMLTAELARLKKEQEG